MAEDDDQTYEPMGDYVAARVEAYNSLVATLVTVTDEELRKECLAMLRATRMSFKTLPQGELTLVPKAAMV